MLELAERYDTLLVSIRNDEEADLVDAEHENGRQALEYLLDRDPATALRLAAASPSCGPDEAEARRVHCCSRAAIAATPGG